ncbi:histidinol-phosphate transaminase [Tropicimonas sp. IMCC6043]|uniref:pyridoxal phosphate-dependent aminotransferase n=1 Tax=Tropicimonas sp. IMCC6043 TaxID=2510645 RepID=UPI0013EDF75E|nr:histidinol-phosphate transaminase [Tropicimonas sp. IMCC6043]
MSDLLELHPIPVPRIMDIRFPALPQMPEEGDLPDPRLVRMNLNEAPMQPSPKALAAARDALEASHRYPDHHATALVAAIAAETGVARDRIVLGNGSGELLVQSAQIALEAGDDAVMPSPTFPTCGKGVQMVGARIIDVPLRADGANDVPAMLAAMTGRTRLFYLCTPNNPTGNVLSAEELRRAIAEVPKTCLLVVDEAYFGFTALEAQSDVLALLRARSGPWVVTRTFSKAYCLAGLRIGYALCSSADVALGFTRIRHNFNVSRPSLAAARAAFLDTAHLRQAVAQTVAARENLRRGLEALGFTAAPSFANFLTVRRAGPAAPLADALGREGIAVQFLPWPVPDGSLRITVGGEAEGRRLLEAMASILEASGGGAV